MLLTIQRYISARVYPKDNGPTLSGVRKSVADMRPGEVAVISGFTEESMATKLLEMGFLPGSSVRFNYTAPLGDPICVSVSGYDLAIRVREASTITIID